jgi:multidrug efflux pump subunit AcrA (membrane-fusion protein)
MNSLSFCAAAIFLFATTSFAAIDKKTTVYIKELKVEKFSDKVQYPGRVVSNINAWVHSETSGEIKKIVKPIGTVVKKGETVLIIQNTDPVFNYAPVRITSPTSGVVTLIEVNLLSRVDRGQKLFLITDPKQLVVETEIPAADLKYFSISQTGVLKDNQNMNYDVQVKALSPVVDASTGTASAKLNLTGSNSDQLRSGQMGAITFEINHRQSIVIPENALVYRDGKPFVRLLENGQAKRIPVTLSQNFGDTVEIASGLTAGQKLITRWSRFIADNEEVEAQSSEVNSSETQK